MSFSGANSSSECVHADHLVVATAANQIKKPPDENVCGFNGELLHASDFCNKAPFSGKRVLVVGIGESASDIACDLTEVAADVTIWLRRHAILAPRFTKQFFTSDTYDEATMLKASSAVPVSDYLETGTTSRVLAHNQSIACRGCLSHHLWRTYLKTRNSARYVHGIMGKGLAANDLLADQAAFVTKNGRPGLLISQGKVNDINVLAG